MSNGRAYTAGPLLIVGVVLMSGCAKMKQDNEAMKARGTVEAGGYTWSIPAESEGSITIRTNGVPTRQSAIEAATIICKKYGRVAQYVKQEGSMVLGFQQFDFNCVK